VRPTSRRSVSRAHPGTSSPSLKGRPAKRPLAEQDCGLTDKRPSAPDERFIHEDRRNSGNLQFRSAFIEGFAIPRPPTGLPKSPKTSGNLTTIRKWWAHWWARSNGRESGGTARPRPIVSTHVASLVLVGNEGTTRCRRRPHGAPRPRRSQPHANATLSKRSWTVTPSRGGRPCAFAHRPGLT
jgi:hypothetical protein